MKTINVTPEQMDRRTAHFRDLKTYQELNQAQHNLPAAAMEMVTARRVYPVMVPEGYVGRSALAPVKGPRGLVLSIAECPPGEGPGLHCHEQTVENFFCLSGRFEIAWGDEGEHTLVLDPLDMVSVPRGVNRRFRNISDTQGRLLVMIVPETEEQSDRISYAPKLASEIEQQFGKETVETMKKIGITFEAGLETA
jgi:mannose-6-phosphate isomerase-like protein (cupin superfamily)